MINCRLTPFKISHVCIKFLNYFENRSIQTRRAYLPPEDVEGKVHRIVKEVYGKTADVQNIDLDEDRRKKFTVSVKPLYLYFADCLHF